MICRSFCIRWLVRLWTLAPGVPVGRNASLPFPHHSSLVRAAAEHFFCRCALVLVGTGTCSIVFEPSANSGMVRAPVDLCRVLLGLADEREKQTLECDAFVCVDACDKKKFFVFVRGPLLFLRCSRRGAKYHGGWRRKTSKRRYFSPSYVV